MCETVVCYSSIFQSKALHIFPEKKTIAPGIWELAWYHPSAGSCVAVSWLDTQSWVMLYSS